MPKKDSASETSFMTPKRGKTVPAKDGNEILKTFLTS